MNMKALIEAWFMDTPQEAALFVKILSTRYGTTEADELLSRYKKDEAERYNKLKTGLEGRYQATEADVARKVGEEALKKKTTANNASITPTSQSQRERELEGVFQEQQFQGFLRIAKRLIDAEVGSTVSNDSVFMNRFTRRVWNAGGIQGNRIVTVYNLAAELDDSTKPSNTAIDLAIEAVKQRR